MFFATLSLLIFSLFWYLKSRQHPKAFPSGPRIPLPFLGLTGDFAKDIKKISDKYGDGNLCGFWLGNYRVVTVKNFETIQFLLNHPNAMARQPIAANYLRGGYSIDKSPPGIVFAHGQTWKTLRTVSTHYLKDLGMGKKVFDDLIEHQAELLVNHIQKYCLDKPVLIEDLCFQVTVSVIWRIIAGQDLPLDHERLEIIFKAVRNYLGDLGLVIVQSTMDSEFLSRLIEWIGFTQQKQNHLKLFNEIDKVIQDLTDVPGDESTITEAFLNQMKTDPSDPLLQNKLGMLNLRNVLLDLVIAATDTTSCTLQWCIFYLLKYPEWQKRIGEEIGLKNQPYTDAFILESIRKGNLGPTGFPRRTEGDILLDDEHLIPKDTLIIPMLGEIYNNPTNFPQPELFDPERYLKNENGSSQCMFVPNPKVIQFQLGKRRCPAEGMAKLQLKIVLQKLLNKYDMLPASTLREVPTAAIIKGPLPFKALFKPKQ